MGMFEVPKNLVNFEPLSADCRWRIMKLRKSGLNQTVYHHKDFCEVLNFEVLPWLFKVLDYT